MAQAAANVPINDLARQGRAVAGPVQAALARVAASGWYVMGRELEAFEAAFARYCGARHCFGVANGTDALELGLRVVGVRRGDVVLTVANAGMYASSAIRAVGATPGYIDVDPASSLMSLEALDAALRAPAAAVVATHLYGRMLDVERVADLATRAGVPLVEDCAQAHGAALRGRRAGTVGALGCFSFYPTKNLGALGDAGAVVTDSDAHAAALRSLRQYGWSSKYVAGVAGGRNSRMDEIQAAVLAAKLPFLDGWNARRRQIAGRYDASIRHRDITLPPSGGDDFVAHLYVVRAPRRDALRAHLAACGIGTDVHYPLADHRQAPFAADANAVALPVTDALAGEVLSLPCFPEMTDDEVGRVIGACNAWRD